MPWRCALALFVAAIAAGQLAQAGSPAPTGWRVWSGQPAMISNVGVYRAHEFIYQDYIYDDHGPNTDGIDHTDAPFGASADPEDPTNPRLGSSGGQIRHAGDFFYGSSNNYYDNAADLIDFRVAADASNTYYQFRLGALTRPD